MPLGSRKQQLVLAILLSSPNSLISVESLMTVLWDDQPPRTAHKNIQVYICAIRSLLQATESTARISHRLGGYVLHIDPAELDSLRFEEMVRAGIKLGQAEQASAAAGILGEALALWRGPALEGVRSVPIARVAAERLEERYLSALEYWAEARTAEGGAADVVEPVTSAAIANPFRERLRMVQMTALCEIGRRAEALAVFGELRVALATELGLDPSQALVQFYQSLLRDGDRAAPVGCPAPRGHGRSLPLPRDPFGFTGREDCVRKLTAVLTGSEPVAVLAGPVGVGKTGLAVHAAHQVRGYFPDGQFFVRMRAGDGTPLAARSVVGSLLQAVGQPRWADADLDDAWLAWQDWLAGHAGLIVLDDVCQEASIAAALPESGPSAVIVTARHWLAGLATAHRRISICPLSLAEALALLGQLIGAGRLASDNCSAERIVVAAGSLPLAVRSLGERIASLRHVPLREFAARLTSPDALCDELTAGDGRIAERVRIALADLSAQDRHATSRLARLPGRCFRLADAALALDLPSVAALRVLERLLAASVLAVPAKEMAADAVVYEMAMLPHAWAARFPVGLPAAIA